MSIYKIILVCPVKGTSEYLAEANNPSQAVTAIVDKVDLRYWESVYVICEDDNICTTTEDFNFEFRPRDGYLSLDVEDLPEEYLAHRQGVSTHKAIMTRLEQFKDIWETKK